MARWRFDAPCAPDRLRRAGDELDAQLEARGVSLAGRSAARVVSEEIVLNALQHGRAAFVELESDGEEPYRLRFEDDGVPFDPTAGSPAPERDPIAGPRLRGRGLALVRTLTRRMDYARLADRNRLTVLLAD